MNIGKASKWNLWAFFVVLALGIWACDPKDDPAPTQNEVQGKWKLESITGGIIGKGYIADWNVLELNANLTFRRLQNDTLRYQGTYALQQKEGKTWINFKPSANPSNAPFENQDKEVLFEKEKFILSDPCCDLYQYEFSKVKN